MYKFFAFVLVLVGSFIYTLYADPTFAAIVGVNPPLAEHVDSIVPVAVFLIAVVSVVALVRRIMESEAAIPFVMMVFVLLIVGGATYIYSYGDKNGDGKGDVQVLMFVQPVGDPNTDSQYAEINGENAKTNLLSMVTITLYIFVILVAFVVGAGIALFSHYRMNSSK